MPHLRFVVNFEMKRQRGIYWRWGFKPFWTMRIIRKTIKYFSRGVLLLTVITVSYFGFRYWTRNMKPDDLITVESRFMQYACGDENDDHSNSKG